MAVLLGNQGVELFLGGPGGGSPSKGTRGWNSSLEGQGVGNSSLGESSSFILQSRVVKYNVQPQMNKHEHLTYSVVMTHGHVPL